MIRAHICVRRRAAPSLPSVPMCLSAYVPRRKPFVRFCGRQLGFCGFLWG